MRPIFQTREDIFWGLGGMGHTQPAVVVESVYNHHIQVDPYPCYTHDESLARAELAECDEIFPALCWEYDAMTVVAYDFMDRTNGISYEEHPHERKDGSKWVCDVVCHCGCGKTLEGGGHASLIVLSGKRIPIMPAMTRYLVAHEFGHCVFNRIAYLTGWHHSDKRKLEEAYIQIRAPEFKPAKRYAGGLWHENTGEIIANDFRTLIMGKEMEFWPHPVPMAKPTDPIADWWRERFERCGARPRF